MDKSNRIKKVYNCWVDLFRREKGIKEKRTAVFTLNYLPHKLRKIAFSKMGEQGAGWVVKLNELLKGIN